MHLSLFTFLAALAGLVTQTVTAFPHERAMNIKIIDLKNQTHIIPMRKLGVVNTDNDKEIIHVQHIDVIDKGNRTLALISNRLPHHQGRISHYIKYGLREEWASCATAKLLANRVKPLSPVWYRIFLARLPTMSVGEFCEGSWETTAMWARLSLFKCARTVWQRDEDHIMLNAWVKKTCGAWFSPDLLVMDPD